MGKVLTSGASLILFALAAACGDGGSKPVEQSDAGPPGSNRGDAEVEYKGPTRGGQIPEGSELEPEKGDDGPFEVSDACCDVTLSVARQSEDVSGRVVGDLAPLDGMGKAASVVGDTFSLTVCMPVSEAVKYRFEVEEELDGGTHTVYRTDPTKPTIDDADGDTWNLSAFNSCDEVDGG